MTYPLTPLGEVLTQDKDYIAAPEARTYPKLSVKLYGRGVELDAPTDGTTLKMQRHQLAKAGQVILSEIWGKKGAIGLVPTAGAGALCTSHFFLFWINKERTLPGYLSLIFQANYLEPQLGAGAFGSTGYAAVRPAHLLAATIPLPPVEEQRRIVARVDAIASRTTEARRLREDSARSVEAVETAVLLQTLQTTTCKKQQLRDVIQSHDTGWSPQCTEEPAKPGQWGVLKTTCVQWSGFDATQNKALLESDLPRPELQPRRGDVLVTRAGPVNRVGVACAIRSEAPLLMISDKVVRLRPTSEVTAEFLALVMRSPECQEYFRHGKTGLAESQVNISREKLLGLTLTLPRSASSDGSSPTSTRFKRSWTRCARSSRRRRPNWTRCCRAC
jgi:hypothetical protein